MEDRYRTGSAGTETVRQYIYGPTGLLAIRDNATDYFVLKDHLGSTRVAFNGSTGAVVAWFDYSPYGKVARSFETSTMIRYTYTGQERDLETGLMNYKARMYDPAIGRFYAMDPMGQTPSFYNYCGNNPVSFTDPSGEWFVIPAIIALAKAAAVGAAVGATISGGTYIAFAGKDATWSGFGRSVGLGAVGGAITGGFGSIGTALGQNMVFNTLGSIANYSAQSAILGENMSIAGLSGALAGGVIGGLIPNFTGIKDLSPGQNGLIDLVHGAVKGGITGGFSNGIASSLGGGSFKEGFASGFGKGLAYGLVQTSMQHVILGLPTPTAKLDKMNSDIKATGGNGSNEYYKPVLRVGGLLSRYTNISIGNDMIVTTSESNYLVRHEGYHYYQQINGGFGDFYWDAISIQWFSDPKIDYYSLPGSLEYDARQMGIYYGK